MARLKRRASSDGPWAAGKPLSRRLHWRRHCPAKMRLNVRMASRCVLVLLETGISHENLRQAMGCTSGMKCRRRTASRTKLTGRRPDKPVIIPFSPDDKDFPTLRDSSPIKALRGGRRLPYPRTTPPNPTP